jgi:2-keto-4-pentenoate hydratase/2-oxohepta-3-ene-1,7-dioic acid hydratase in catechol pathway
MKITRFLHKGKIYSGIVHGDHVSTERNFFPSRNYELNDVKLLAPVIPSKIVAVGLNYKDHAAELDMKLPDEPIIFIKPSTAVVGPEDDIIYPCGIDRVDYEAELAVVIGKIAKDIEADKAGSYILGYTCMNDVTARDIQKKDVQWSRSKSFDTFAPVGPWIETDLDTGDLYVRSYLNGELKQSSDTSEFIFSIPEIVSFVSKVMTLMPGDIISTGTPAGIGPMRPGDEVVVEVENIGRLHNYVKLKV